MIEEFHANAEHLTKDKVYTLMYTTFAILRGRNPNDMVERLFRFVRTQNPHWQIDEQALIAASKKMDAVGHKILEAEPTPILSKIAGKISVLLPGGGGREGERGGSALPHGSYGHIREISPEARRMSDQRIREVAITEQTDALRKIFTEHPFREIDAADLSRIFNFILQVDDELLENMDGLPAKSPGASGDMQDPWLSYICRYVIEKSEMGTSRAMGRFGEYKKLFDMFRENGFVRNLLVLRDAKIETGDYLGTDLEKRVNALKRIIQIYLEKHPDRYRLFPPEILERLEIH